MSEAEAPSPGASRIGRTSSARIAAVVSCVPKRVIGNAGYVEKFGEAAEQIIKMTGVRERRVVEDDQTTADLCHRAAEELFVRASVDPASIDAVLFFSQTPDFRLPATACTLQHRLNLPAGIIAFDVNLGCSAYPYALWMASMMIETGAARRVLLLVGDTISKIVAPEDRATAMLFGDAGTATLVEHCPDSQATFILGSDGAGAQNLIVPAGCFRPDRKDERNSNPPDTLFMDGGEIFNFTLRAVPSLASQLLAASGCELSSFDGLLFHQANQFMINHLRKKIKAPAELVPINIDRFGNTSSASIPLLMTTDCRDLLVQGSARLALFGFGVGYSWAAAAIRTDRLACADMVEL